MIAETRGRIKYFTMKSFVVTVSIVLILLAGSLGDPMKKANFKCDADIISCACGETGENVTVPIKMCPSKGNETGKNACKPCSASFDGGDVCSRFKFCETCEDGVFECTSCPEGKEQSKFCNLGPVSMTVAESSDAIHVKIPRGAPLNKLRFARDADSCVLPDRMKSNEIDCTIRPRSTTCIQRCVYGHGFPEGRERTLRCEHNIGIWTPTAVLEECEPIINCQITLTSAGVITCTSHLMKEPTWCRVKCLEYDDHKGSSKTYECRGNELWVPELPFCAKVKTLTTTVAESSEHVTSVETELIGETESVAPVETELIDETESVAPVETELIEETESVAPVEKEMNEETQPAAPVETKVVEETQPAAPVEAKVVEETESVAPVEAKVVEETESVAPVEAKVVEETEPVAPVEAKVVEETEPVAPVEAKMVDEATV